VKPIKLLFNPKKRSVSKKSLFTVPQKYFLAYTQSFCHLDKSVSQVHLKDLGLLSELD